LDGWKNKNVKTPLHKLYNFNIDLACNMFNYYQIPLHLEGIIEIGQKTSVIYKGKLMNVEVLEKDQTFYWVEVIEYPAQKAIHE